MNKRSDKDNNDNGTLAHDEVLQTTFGKHAHLYRQEEAVAEGWGIGTNHLTERPVPSLCGRVEAVGFFEEYDPAADVEWCVRCVRSARKRGVRPLPKGVDVDVDDGD